MPFITVRKNCVWCSGDLFTGYFQRGALHLRQILKNIIFSLNENMLFVNETLPAFVRTTMTVQDPDSLNVNLIAYAPEKRGEAFVVEDGAAVIDGKFCVWIGSRTVKSVKRVNSEDILEHSVENGYLTISIPVFKGYALIHIEF